MCWGLFAGNLSGIRRSRFRLQAIRRAIPLRGTLTWRSANQRTSPSRTRPRSESEMSLSLKMIRMFHAEVVAGFVAALLLPGTPTIAVAQYTASVSSINVTQPTLAPPNYDQVATQVITVTGPANGYCTVGDAETGGGVFSGLQYPGNALPLDPSGSASFSAIFSPYGGSGTYVGQILLSCGSTEQWIFIPFTYTVGADVATPSPAAFTFNTTVGGPVARQNLEVALSGPSYNIYFDGSPLTIGCVGGPSCPAGTWPTFFGMGTGIEKDAANHGISAILVFDPGNFGGAPLPAGTYSVQARMSSDSILAALLRNGSSGFTPAEQFSDVLIPITVVVSAAPTPSIAVSSSALSFNTVQGASSPVPNAVTVTNGGTGALSGLSTGTISYGAGQPIGWLTASLNSTSAPATLTLSPTLGSLAAGTYTATVPVSSTAAGVTNSPVIVTVTFTVTAAPAPTIALSSTTASFASQVGGVSPTAQTIAITNSGTGALTGLATGAVAYGNGQPTGWLAVGLNTTTAPSTLTLTPTLGALAAGVYTAMVPVTSSAGGVTNSPSSVTVTFTVTAAPAPAIALSSASASFTTQVGTSSPPAQTISITNGGTGVLSGLATGPLSYGNGQPTGWLSYLLSPSTAPATLNLTPALGSLAAGTYTATIPIISSAAGVTNSPSLVSVTLIVAAAAPAIGVSNSVSFSGTAGAAAPTPQLVPISNAGGGTLTGLGLGTISYGTGASSWLSAVLGSGSAPTTLTLTATTGSVLAGSYTATVPVSSTIPGVATANVVVTLQIANAPSPAIALALSAVSLSTPAGSRSTVISDSVTSSGAGTLSGLTVSTSYSGTASGWLSATLNGSTAPTGLALMADGTHLAPGTYAASATILQTGEPASARVVSVTLTVSEPTLSSVVRSILNLGTLSAEVQQYLDSLGNKDGVFDLGDILALLDRTGQQLDARTLQAILAIPPKPVPLPGDSSRSVRPTIRP
jgi:hypothetical protein